MTAPSPAGPEWEAVEALAEVPQPKGNHCPGCGWSSGGHGPACRVAAYVAAAVETARREGAETALREAADALEGGLGVEGTPKTLWDFRKWLRARADALRSATEGER